MPLEMRNLTRRAGFGKNRFYHNDQSGPFRRSMHRFVVVAEKPKGRKTACRVCRKLL